MSGLLEHKRMEPRGSLAMIPMICSMFLGIGTLSCLRKENIIELSENNKEREHQGKPTHAHSTTLRETVKIPHF